MPADPQSSGRGCAESAGPERWGRGLLGRDTDRSWVGVRKAQFKGPDWNRTDKWNQARATAAPRPAYKSHESILEILRYMVTFLWRHLQS